MPRGTKKTNNDRLTELDQKIKSLKEKLEPLEKERNGILEEQLKAQVVEIMAAAKEKNMSLEQVLEKIKK